MIIIHGNNQVKAQDKLAQLVTQAKANNLEISRLGSKSLSPTILSQTLTPSSLFSDSRLVIINNLLSLPQSSNKKKLLDILKKSTAKNLILYEGKDTHPATIKSLAPTEVFQFKESPLIYKFTDSLRPRNPKQALSILEEIINNREPLEMLFFMLARHVRQLIQVKTPGSLKLAPWQIGKLNQQSSLFTEEQLIALHQDLYQIDKRQKTSHIKSLELELKHLVSSL